MATRKVLLPICGLAKEATRFALYPRPRSFVLRSKGAVTSDCWVQSTRHRTSAASFFSTNTTGTSNFKVIEERLRKSSSYNVYEPHEEDSSTWKVSSHIDTCAETSGGSGSLSLVNFLRTELLPHVLPANYPDSVAPGYGRYTSFCFAASIAGSTAMVLSTQTLLLAVGVVGSQTQASVMAGALNWVLKDGIGQLGGVLFASQVSQSKLFDKSPKIWRMVAAISLDLATLLEILSPLVPSALVLPMASIANIGKNIGFLTASASRAAIHQSMATTGNLGDVTAKAGSQSILASLIGTTLGIGMSPFLEDVPHFCMGFVALSMLHQVCNYLSLRSVSLRHLDRHRLHLVLAEYMETGNVLSPDQVAQREVFFPGIHQDNTYKWLLIGSSLRHACRGGPAELQKQRSTNENSRYLVTQPVEEDPAGMVHLVFHKHATAKDVIEGMLHAHLIHLHRASESHVQTELDEEVRARCRSLLAEMEELGWKFDDVDVEASDSVRIQIVEGN